jgi:hypothetical protein
MNTTSHEDRLVELLTDRALVGLDPAEDSELAHLLAIFPDADRLAREIELSAAAVAIAGISEQGMVRMPAAMIERLEAAAMGGGTARTQVSAAPPKALQQTVQMPWTSAPTVPAPFPSVHPAQPANAWGPPPPSQPFQQQQGANVIPLHAMNRVEKPTRSGAGRAVAIAGWLAAAACLALAVSAWYLRPRTQIVTVNVPTPPPSFTVAPPASAAPTPQQERDGLLARAGTARLDWSKNAKDPASKQATGDVVWNAAEQRGYMRFKGLAKNDKRANVYQLWIFDKSREDKYPVDGGVFTIDDDSGDVIVPIKARLPVGEVALFAVTVEKPGGVVVSKRERIVVTAKPAT